MGEIGSDNSHGAWMTPAEFEPWRMPLGELTPPAQPLVHLWYVNLGSLWETLSAVMAGDQQAAGKVPMNTRQLRFARQFYLRMLLGAYMGVAGKDVGLLRGERGKPEIDQTRHGDGLHFSLAKSGERLLIGISGSAEIGVDLELEYRKPRSARGLARRFFTPFEAESICSVDPAAERDAAFMRTWACKEAVAKASGHGIANRFCRFSISAGALEPPTVVEDEDHAAESWRLALVVPERGYIAAVAVRQPSLRVEGFRL